MLEASITIDGVVVVMDSCLVGAAEFAPGPKVESISSFKARVNIECRQRRGRAGRTLVLFKDLTPDRQNVVEVKERRCVYIPFYCLS